MKILLSIKKDKKYFNKNSIVVPFNLILFELNIFKSVSRFLELDWTDPKRLNVIYFSHKVIHNIFCLHKAFFGGIQLAIKADTVKLVDRGDRGNRGVLGYVLGKSMS